MAGTSMASGKRRELDIRKLMLSDYDVEMVDDGGEFMVMFNGPPDTHYVGGLWKVQVTLPKDYPFRSPSIGFKNRLFHPNVDESSGSVCLDVINQTWSPMYDLVNIFDIFLPQLLAYPNPSDPLNSEAASLMLRDANAYEERVKEHVRTYALSPGACAGREGHRDSNASASSSSSATSASSSGSGETFASISTAEGDICDGKAGTALAGGDSRERGQNQNDEMEGDDDDDNDDDDLSSLSDGSDGEGDLVLDL